MKKLIDYREKVKIATIVAAVVAVILALVYVGMMASAQASYFDRITDYSLLSDYAAQHLAEDTSRAQPIMYLAAIASVVSGISLTLWMLANLLIAYKTPDEDPASSR